jgi:solute carrier family 13 (sodium-dependent dicarboxylate transporter), member 2/3/5
MCIAYDRRLANLANRIAADISTITRYTPLVEYPRISASGGRRTIGLFLDPLLTVAFLVLPMDIPREQQVLLGVIALWITEAVPIPVGGLLGVAFAVFLGFAPVDDVLGPFGTSTIFTFIGAFILAQPMLKHGVARRFAFRILALPGAGRPTTGVILAFGAITCLLSAFVSNTGMVAMLLPTAIGILSYLLVNANTRNSRSVRRR